jgi:hypothetical protein
VGLLRAGGDVRIYAAVVPGTGTLTLLFTDLVGSTESLVALGKLERAPAVDWSGTEPPPKTRIPYRPS